MRNRKIYILMLCVVSILFTNTLFGQVGIGTTTPHASSVLDVTSTDKGVLFPRLTTAQRDAITSPAEGLTIYNTSESCIQFNRSTNGSHDWYSLCSGAVSLTPAEIFAELTTNMSTITSSRYLTADNTEPEVAGSGRVGFGISNVFVDWNADGFDQGGWIFIDQPLVTDISSSNLLPYTTGAGSTGGSVSTHSLLGGEEYFTNFSTTRKLFSFYAKTPNNTSVKFVSDTGIDGNSDPSISGSATSTNGNWHMYYQSVDRNSTTNDAFITHIFFVKESESSNVTFEVYNTNLGSTIGDQTTTTDDYSGIIKWTSAGDVNEVYGFILVLGSGDTAAGPKATVSELFTIADEIATDVLPNN